jgi:hypothetical protein
VEVVTLSCTPDHHDGQWMRNRYCDYFVADVRSLDELTQYVTVEELEEALGDPASPAPYLLQVRRISRWRGRRTVPVLPAEIESLLARLYGPAAVRPDEPDDAQA